MLLQLLLTFYSKTYSYHHLPTFKETRWTEKGSKSDSRGCFEITDFYFLDTLRNYQ